MTRPRTAAVLHEACPVRVTRGSGRFRVRWVEDGVDRERSATNLEDAKTMAGLVAGRLALAGDGAISGAVAYGAPVEEWVETYRPTWSVGPRCAAPGSPSRPAPRCSSMT